MRRLLFLGALGAAFGLAAAAVSVAQGQPAASGAPAADSSAPAAASSGPSVDSTISDLLANPTTKAVLAKDLPALLTYDGLDQIKGMSIRQISQFPQANIDATKLAQIQTDLQASGSGAAAPAAASNAPAAASSAPAAPQ
jgi:hypothetical protein